jgi:UDP-N-acetylmuramate--alanine ligase
LQQGWQVSGSDLTLSPVAQALADAGAAVYRGHDASHVGQVDVVLVSSAVPEGNPEVLEARRRGIPVLKRAEFLGRLMEGKTGIAVAGTHGKTTTTSMVIWILVQADLDPTFVVGGVMETLNTNARAGQGPHFVIEADEYDRMFLGLRPTVAAITHLEHDHPDCYPTFAEMEGAFEQFLSLVPAEGLIVGCGDQSAVDRLVRGYARSREAGARGSAVQLCGIAEGNDWHTPEVWPNVVGGHDFEVYCAGQRWGDVRLRVPGLHNVQNALVAVAVAHWLGVDAGVICQALATFPGVERRFQVRGQAGERIVIDDYGHHPTEIAATLGAARARYGDRPLWAVFQPHTYSRIRALWDDFVASFGQADHVVVLDVYAARESDTLGVSAAGLVAQMEHPDARHIGDLEAAAEHVALHAEPNAVVITLSAGDGNEVGRRALDRWMEA